MAKDLPGWTLGELADLLDGELAGPADFRVRRLVPAGESDPEGLTFAGSPEYLAKAAATEIGAVLISRTMEPDGVRAVRVDDPKAAFGRLLQEAKRKLPLESGVHPSAVVHPDAQVDPTASIGPGAVVDAGAVIGPRVRVHAHAYIGEMCMVGEDSVLYPNCVLVQDVRMGARCTIHSGAVLGGDGFGYLFDGERRIKVPQIGGVRIGDDVEIGANSCIDRATMGDTVIGDGVKIDNLVQVGHNVEIGDHSVLTGMVGIGGSSRLGKRVVVGANAGISDHVTIGDDVQLGGRSGVASDITEPGEYFGQPAQPKREAIRTFLLLPRLPEIWNRLRKLERRAGISEEE